MEGKKNNLCYTSTDVTMTTDVSEYIRNYRDTDHFLSFCKQCGNYGKRWGCPPLEEEELKSIEAFRYVLLVGTRIIPEDKNLPLSEVETLMKPEIIRLNRKLLQKEAECGGKSFGFGGNCLYCGKTPCARIEGKPCRHSDKCRSSLEAFGFDLSKTAKNILGLDILWSKEGKIPEYLTLVSGLFHNKEELIW